MQIERGYLGKDLPSEEELEQAQMCLKFSDGNEIEVELYIPDGGGVLMNVTLGQVFNLLLGERDSGTIEDWLVRLYKEEVKEYSKESLLGPSTP